MFTIFPWTITSEDGSEVIRTDWYVKYGKWIISNQPQWHQAVMFINNYCYQKDIKPEKIIWLCRK